MSTAVPASLRICHIADVHLGFRRYHRMTSQGYNQREADVSAAFREAVEHIVRLQPHVVIIAGDLFHTVRPSNAVVTFCFKQLKRLSRHTSAKIVLIGGNHDSPKRMDSGSLLRLFKEIDSVFVADNAVETFTFRDLDLSVTCAPHAVLARGLSEPLRAPDSVSHAVLVAHAQVDERLRSEFGGSLVPLDTLSPNEWDYIALGHVHRFMQVSHQAVYPGSLEHTSGNFWIDAQTPKGFVEVSLPAKDIIFHQVHSARPVTILDPVDATELDPEDVMARISERIEAVPGGIDGKILRLDVGGIRREVARNLDYRTVRKYKSRALHLQLDLRIQTTEPVMKAGSGKGSGTLRDEIAAYCDPDESTLREPELVQERVYRYLDMVEALHETALD